jgi:flagellar hook-associated protein 1 FlgK
MSLSTSLSNAVSGLTASARSAEVVSTNVANAMTEGYARREILLSSRAIGGIGQGVQVDGVRRVVDAGLMATRRTADAAVAGLSVTAGFYARMESVLGTPDQPGSLTARISGFETALMEAASRPESEARLATVLAEAKGMIDAINTAGKEVQVLRTAADQAIALDVATLNDSLKRIEQLNRTIATTLNSGRDAGGLFDQRQVLIDRVAEIVPVREIERDFGRVALYTPGGALLLDGPAPEIGFTPVNVVVADMTIQNGSLQGLTINGRPLIETQIAGGRLAANLALRDVDGPGMQAALDAMARDLVMRFEDPTYDTSLAAGTPGLFTDNGGAFDPAAEVGLAGRLAINISVDTAQGGALWRLRDGVGAIAAGPVGDGRQLDRFVQALSEPLDAVSGPFGPGKRSFGGLASALVSVVGTSRNLSEADQGYQAARAGELRTLEARNGVDTDDEMQRLLLIERAYAANARVISAVDEMMLAILRI